MQIIRVLQLLKIWFLAIRFIQRAARRTLADPDHLNFNPRVLIWRIELLKLLIMRNIKLIATSLLVLFAALACENDQYYEDGVYLKSTPDAAAKSKMVPFKGNFVSSPSDLVPIECSGDNNPATGEPFAALKINKVTGNATHLGVLDDLNSQLIAESCSLDAQAGILSVELNITFKNKNGDGIEILGISDITLAGPASGSYEVVKGFGKFEGAQGTVQTTGFFNGETGVAEFRAEGMISQPNR